jgi:hypothetical protein
MRSTAGTAKRTSAVLRLSLVITRIGRFKVGVRISLEGLGALVPSSRDVPAGNILRGAAPAIAH